MAKSRSETVKPEGEGFKATRLEDLATEQNLNEAKTKIEEVGLTAFIQEHQRLGRGAAGNVFDLPEYGAVIKVQNPAFIESYDTQRAVTKVVYEDTPEVIDLKREARSYAELSIILHSGKTEAINQAAKNPRRASMQVLPSVSGESDGTGYLILPRVEMNAPHRVGGDDVSELPAYVPLQLIKFYDDLARNDYLLRDVKGENYQLVKGDEGWLTFALDNSALEKLPEGRHWETLKPLPGFLHNYANNFCRSTPEVIGLFASSGAEEVKASASLSRTQVNTVHSSLRLCLTEAANDGKPSCAMYNEMLAVNVHSEGRALLAGAVYLSFVHSNAYAEKSSLGLDNTVAAGTCSEVAKFIFGSCPSAISELSADEPIKLEDFFEVTVGNITSKTRAVFASRVPAVLAAHKLSCSTTYGADKDTSDFLKLGFDETRKLSGITNFAVGLEQFAVLTDMAQKTETSGKFADNLALFAEAVVSADPKTDIRAFIRLVEGARAIASEDHSAIKTFTDMSICERNVSPEAKKVLDALTGIPNSTATIVSAIAEVTASESGGKQAFVLKNEAAREELAVTKVRVVELTAQNEALVSKLGDAEAQVATLTEVRDALLTTLQNEQRKIDALRADLARERAQWQSLLDLAEERGKRELAQVLQEKEAGIPSERQAREVLRKDLNKVAFYEHVAEALGVDLTVCEQEAQAKVQDQAFGEAYRGRLTAALVQKGLLVHEFKEPEYAKFNGAVGVAALNAEASKGDREAKRKLAALKAVGIVPAIDPATGKETEWLELGKLSWY